MSCEPDFDLEERDDPDAILVMLAQGPEFQYVRHPRE
jgi:hypothetical protein